MVLTSADQFAVVFFISFLREYQKSVWQFGSRS